MAADATSGAGGVRVKWHSLGHVYKCDDWGQTPTPLVLSDRVRVYVAARDAEGKSYTRFVDLDLDDPTRILDVSGEVLGRGKPGTFDQDGAMPSFATLEDKHTVKLWYSGWTAPAGVTPYHNATGIAVSHNGGRTFEREFDGPRLDRTQREPYLRVTPCVCSWHLYYVSGLRWELIDGRYEPIYVIRMENNPDNPIAIPQKHERECFSRPWVTKHKDLWTMLYSYRDAHDYRGGPGAYRIGYATSHDGLDWNRHDNLFDLPRSDFDSQMQAYTATFEAKGKTYLLWNGDHFGKHGFGLAVTA